MFLRIKTVLGSLAVLFFTLYAPTPLRADIVIPGSGNSCRPEVRCDVCSPQGQHTCRVINCEGAITATFAETCIPPVGSNCEALERCSACIGFSQTCRTIDCNGRLQAEYTQQCNGTGSGPSEGPGSRPGICSPTTTTCERTCPPSGNINCQVLDCNGLPVTNYPMPCTPPPAVYSCSDCASVGGACNYRAPSIYIPHNIEDHTDGRIYCYSVSKTFNGETTNEERVCGDCIYYYSAGDDCRNRKQLDARCRR